jgi:hypothetical protein
VKSRRPKPPPDVPTKANDPKGERVAPEARVVPARYENLDALLTTLRHHEVASYQHEEGGEKVTINLFQRRPEPPSEGEQAKGAEAREEGLEVFERKMRFGAAAAFARRT